MALATTQAVWRSGGGDQTRAAYCGSMVMAASFYIPDASLTTSTNVQSSATITAPVVLPANAVIYGVIFNDATTAGTIDIGFTTNTSNVNSPEAIINNAGGSVGTVATGATGSGTSLGSVLSSSELVTITFRDNSTTATGTVGGYFLYFVNDVTAGQQNV